MKSLILFGTPNAGELTISFLVIVVSLLLIVYGAVGIGKKANNLGMRITALVIGLVLILFLLSLIFMGVAASH